MSEKKKPNRLAREKSPYLLQHVYNPVDWYPWGEEAFARAKAEQKPVFLSIGYSTCHWCHVMEKESFEDEEVAELLNRHFISVKVDREERPDVDHLYMAVCQAMTGHGGWPLTVVMTPDKKPFFAGTYFPKKERYGRYGLMEILPQLIDIWNNARAKAEQAGDKIVHHVKRHAIGNVKGTPDGRLIDTAAEQFRQSFDETFGGFGKAPKFPTPHNLSFLLRYATLKQDAQALRMAEKTLEMMARGGIHDHIGFGFSRYSTDDRWLVPHFEKMLYDNALLAMAYTDAFQATGKTRYRQVAERILQYVLRDMTDPQGGFYSAEDADSEGAEGKFYVWTPDEIEAVLDAESASLFMRVYGITRDGHFEGKNIPNLLAGTPEAFAEREGMPAERLAARLEEARAKLFAAREKRIRPHRDDKVLTGWNGLMIAAMARAARAFGDARFAGAAKRAAAFIERHLVREDGRLLARWRDGEAAYPAYLDDYAFLAWGLIELYEATFDAGYLRRSLEWMEKAESLFLDREEGGYFFSGSDGEELFARVKETYDGAMPSGNSAMALNWIRLARMTGNAEMEERFRRQMEACAGSAGTYPAGHALLATAMLYAYEPAKEIVISGDGEEAEAMARAVQQSWLPNAVIMRNVPGPAGEEARALMPVIADKGPAGGRPAVYICRQFACQAPVTDLAALKNMLAR